MIYRLILIFACPAPRPQQGLRRRAIDFPPKPSAIRNIGSTGLLQLLGIKQAKSNKA